MTKEMKVLSGRALGIIKLSLIAFFSLSFTHHAIAKEKQVHPSSIPVEHFFKKPQFTDMVISPDGKHIAAIYEDKDNSSSVAIMDINLTKVLTSINLGEYRRISEIIWPRNDRFIINYAKFVGYLDDNGSQPSYVAYNLNGKRGIQLTDGNRAFYEIVSLLPDKPDKILVQKRNFQDYNDRGSDLGQIPARLFEIDIDTGKEKYTAGQPANVNDIIADTNGVPRMAFGYTEDRNDELGGGSFYAYVKRTPTSDWESIDTEHMRYPDSKKVARVRLLGFNSDNSKAYVASDYNSKLPSVYEVDMKTLDFTHIFTPERATIGAPLYSPNGGLEGLMVSPDFNRILFLSEKSEMRRVFAQLYATFEVTDESSNIQIHSATEDGNQIIFSVSSDRDPGVFYLYNRGLDGSAPGIRLLSESKPEINPNLMASMKPMRFESRDGIELNGYYMLPTYGEAPYPMVQIIHGGPHGPRDFWQWDREAQFLASRGYAVVKVNFRGSGGYGVDFEESGHLEWGGKMINDMTDASMWMVKQGFADKDKMCVYGGSYGGYGTLQSLVREPDLYKCGIGYVGVYSLFEMKKSGDIPKRNEGMRFLDKVLGTDEDLMRKFSPALNVDKIKANLFIAHGSEDERVPMEQYEVLTENLEKIGKPFIPMVKEEGHGYQLLENNVEFYSTMEQFLADNLKK
ncbi:alpha/beta hydrolase family protein [Alteromonas ponticola]|uniref:S9 family peptidase n=1 Tax=Alteromonas ponticola TaxID=2720613 RepID=A0ABX1QY44_9ALTE|nr:prolyl oligopeptidase family serine peptidase [Alteromonas ponticola]NMH59160.1 S9 family peptidase [Alteromonas ponticola]